MEQQLFYPIYLFIVFCFTLIFIPKQNYKELFIYGFLIGGFGDIVQVALYQNVFHTMWFKNLGFFNVLGQHILSPLSWTVTIMLFLHFMPNRRWFLYFYILTFGMFSVGYGYLVRNIGLFDFKPWFYPIISFFGFFAWWSFAAWFFRKTSSLAKD